VFKFRLIITYELILELIGFIPNQLNGHRKIFFRNFADFCQVRLNLFNFWLDYLSVNNGWILTENDWFCIKKSQIFFNYGFLAILVEKRNVIFPVEFSTKTFKRTNFKSHEILHDLFWAFFWPKDHIRKNAFSDSENFRSKFSETTTAKGKHNNK